MNKKLDGFIICFSAGAENQNIARSTHLGWMNGYFNCQKMSSTFHSIAPPEADEQIHLPFDAVEHAELIQCLRKLGEGKKWIFQNRAGTPIDHTNARRRYLKPAAAAVGVQIGGWHDFRHTLPRTLRPAGVHPVLLRHTLGHSKLDAGDERVRQSRSREYRRQAQTGRQEVAGQRCAAKGFATKHSETS